MAGARQDLLDLVEPLDARMLDIPPMEGARTSADIFQPSLFTAARG